MFRRKYKPQTSTCVLALNEHSVEWLDLRDSQRPQFGRADVLGSKTVNYLEATQLALANASHAGPIPNFVLALGNGFARQDFVQLPKLNRGDKAAVLNRKACRLIGEQDGEAIFTACLVDPLGQGRKSIEQARESWMLSVARKAKFIPLMSALENNGLFASRVILRHSAAWNTALGLCGNREQLGSATTKNEERAGIVVSIKPGLSSVALMVGRRLITRYELKGVFFESATLGSNLLQDIRSCQAFWRNVSRGDAIEKVLLFGLDAKSSAPIQQSIEALVEGVIVETYANHPDHSEAGAISGLQTCLDAGPFQAELPVRSRSYRRQVGGLAASACVAALALTGWVGLDAEAQTVSNELENGLLSDRVEKFELEARDYWATKSRADIALADVESLVALAESGIPFTPLLTQVIDAFENRATLFVIGVTELSNGDRKLQVSGRLSAEPFEMMQAVDQALETLERSGLLTDTQISPSSAVSDSGASNSMGGESDSRQLDFTLTATITRGRS